MKIDLITQRLIHALTNNDRLAVKTILLKGSKATPDSTDYWSDTDLEIFLTTNGLLDATLITDCIQSLGQVIGQEAHRHPGKLVLRYLVEFKGDIEQIDLTIHHTSDSEALKNYRKDAPVLLYGRLPKLVNEEQPAAGNFQYDSASIDRTWFTYFQCVKKIMRRDNLIGLHLLLELIKENLVLEMVERDQNKGTNIHRYGDDEQLSWLQELSKLEHTDKIGILHFIRSLSQWYDRRLLGHVPGYRSRFPIFDRYLRKCQMRLVNS